MRDPLGIIAREQDRIVALLRRLYEERKALDLLLKPETTVIDITYEKHDNSGDGSVPISRL